MEPQFGAACLEATGGNPLLVAELLRALKAERARPRASEVGRVRGIGAVAVGPAVRRRLAVLGGGARAVAQAVSVFGQSVGRGDLAGTAALAASELGDALAALTSAGIVRGEERVSFVHPLVGDAVRASLSPSEDARLHERAVRALCQRGASPRELAPHVVAGAVGAHPGAVGVLRQAARWALGAGAPEAAVRYLERAVAELGTDDDRAPVLLELARRRCRPGDPGARDDLERAIEVARRCPGPGDGPDRAVRRAGRRWRGRPLDRGPRPGLGRGGRRGPRAGRADGGPSAVDHRGGGPGLVKFPRTVGERVTSARARRANRGPLSLAGSCWALLPTRSSWGEGRPPRR